MADRKDIIINNLLSEICSKTDIPREDYLPWLRTEIGLSDEDIDDLINEGCLPFPIRAKF